MIKMADVEATGSGTDWREPDRRLGGEDSTCLLWRTAGRPATAPGPGKAATASF